MNEAPGALRARLALADREDAQHPGALPAVEAKGNQDPAKRGAPTGAFRARGASAFA